MGKINYPVFTQWNMPVNVKLLHLKLTLKLVKRNVSELCTVLDGPGKCNPGRGEEDLEDCTGRDPLCKVTASEINQGGRSVSS